MRATSGVRGCRRCGARLARDNTSNRCAACQRAQRDLLQAPPKVPAEFWEHTAVRRAINDRHIGRLIRAFRQHPHHGKPISQGMAAAWLHLTQAQLSRIETGPAVSDLDRLSRWAQILHIPMDLLWFAPSSRPSLAAVTPTDFKNVESAEHLRCELDRALTAGSLSEAVLDDWEHAVVRHGAATRDRPARLLLADIAADLAEVQQILTRGHSASTLRRLTRVVARLSGLMCLTLIKMGDARQASRGWARTARTAALEAGDPVTHSWVLAQEAYGHFYTGDTVEAISVAQHAQAASRSPCVGSVLAAALEARAHAARRDHAGTYTALARAEKDLGQLGTADLASSAFGYDEAQLHFHRGNALTHLGDTAAARLDQDRALELYPDSDFLDRTLTHLDRASCIAQDHDPASAMAYALAVLDRLTDQQRQGIITSRGREIVNALPRSQRALPAVREFHDLLMLTSQENR